MNKNTIGNLCILFSGGTPSTKKPEYWNGDLPWLSSAESGNDFIYDSTTKITQLGADNSATKLAKKNSVIVATAGEGKTRGQVSHLEIDAYINQSLISLTPQKEISDLYLYYYLKNSYLRLRRLSDITGIRGSLSGELIKTFEICYPSLTLQHKITALLRNIDRKIELNNRINNELESIAKTLYNYWFLQFEFPNEERKPYKSSGGKMVWNEELKREIPNGWDVSELKKQVDFISGYPFSSDDYSSDGKYKIYTIKNVQNGYINCDVDNRINDIPSNMDSKCMLNPGDLIMSLTGNVGRIGLVFEKNVLLNQRVLKLIPNNFGKLYIYLLLRDETMRKNIELLASGTSQKNLSPINLGKLKVLLPCKEILNVFEKKYGVIYDKMIKNLIENQILISLRDFLLPLLMNGQVIFKN